MPSNIVLPTVIVEAKSVFGNFIPARALLDCGSQISIIRSDLVVRLGLKRYKSDIPIVGVSGLLANDGEHIVKFYFRSLSNLDVLFSVTAAVFKNPTNYLVTKQSSLNYEIKVSDDGTFISNKVDIILGCDILGQILNGERLDLGQGHNKNGPYALGTVFDYTVFGPPCSVVSDSCVARDERISGTTLLQAVEKFWKTEEPPNVFAINPLDIECERLFSTTTTRDGDGKYITRLPLLPDHKRLGDSKQIAMKRFLLLERRFNRDSEFKNKYVEFVNEYIKLGHMRLSELQTDLSSEHYFLCHHGVFKKSGDVEKIRVVFDGSVKTSTGVSLNDCLYSGPRLQNNITKIIINFRLPLIVFCTDVKMMFRQSWVNPADRKYQLILWRASPSEPIQVFALTTTTYGLKSSPFIAIRCLHQLANDDGHRFPLASNIIFNNSYVDDLYGGADDLAEAQRIKTELIGLMSAGGYELRKWASNNQLLLEGLPSEHIETPKFFDDSSEGFIKVLGVQWNPRDDSFSYRLKIPKLGLVTRRSILSLVSKLYDPLGWISPVVFRMKLYLQSVLGKSNNANKVEWDTPLPDDFACKWYDIITDLSNLEKISLRRCFKLNNNVRYSIHGFCDGSSLGYSASVYLRSVYSDGLVSTHLIIGKSRVAPLRTLQTIPKLELNGALLLCKLINHVMECLQSQLVIDEVVAWCDSTIVLAWLRTPPHELQVFEGNRVSQIISSLVKIQWRHVPSDMNCADVGSRGSSAEAIVEHPLWWGAPWLSLPSEGWPLDISVISSRDIPGLRAKVLVNVCTLDSAAGFDLFSRYSSYDKLLNVTAFIVRFIRISCKNNLRLFSYDRIDNTIFRDKNVQMSERKCALNVLISLVQLEHYSDEIADLKSGKQIRSSLRRLNVFIDKNNLLRVGGRLSNSDLSYSAKYPILLPYKHRFTELLVSHYHKSFCHIGANALSGILSRSYWIVSIRRLTRYITFKCIQCYRLRGVTSQPFMADLPRDRVTEARAFAGVGTDFAGPFLIKSSSLRGAKTQKCYLCVFVCLSTKGVHLEVVSDLSVEAFVAAFTRFVSRRGLPCMVRSDCGTNFTGTNRYLRELYIFIRDNNLEIERNLTNFNIKWLFNSPSAPNQGGLFEAAVKSAKNLAKRVLGETKLTFEELTTFFTKVEAVLNSRPLCPISSDPNDLEVLTPGHFMIGQPLVALPEYSFEATNLNRLSRYQQIQKFSQHFWSRWRNEYLHTLQQRYKWTSVAEPPKLNDLVLIKEDNSSPLQWRRGRIIKLYPGANGVIRNVELKTEGGILMRPISKLCKLPIE